MKILEEKAPKKHIRIALKQLTVYITRKFDKKPIILIDEYDTPILEGYFNDYYEDMMGLMRGVLGEALKDNECLEKAIITGITCVSQESLFSDLNNVEVYSLLREKYGQYFGFTEEEVINLIKTTEQEVSLSSIKELYNGYQVGKYVLYNPWSIVNCLNNNGRLEAYWLHTSSNILIKQLLNKSDPIVKQQFEALLQGEIVEQPLSESLTFQNIETQVESLWSLLLHAGYLKVMSSEINGSELMAKIAIPNKEIRFTYDEIIKEWFQKTGNLKQYASFIQSIVDGNMDKFKTYLKNYIMKSGNFFDFSSNKSEQIFHVFILGLVVGLRDKYTISSNRESGLGRYDVLCEPNDNTVRAILFEFKVSTAPELLKKTAKDALLQIKEKRYITTLQQNQIKSVLAIGLAFCGKEVELVYTKESI
eukprot:GHVL01031240.1.p1 GENE.GHVL01031240.1~~GHVL01031240.1.p1  ORF type:complete len:480 (+),score=75.54 GHVL01031240.1:182-1441(+)